MMGTGRWALEVHQHDSDDTCSGQDSISKRRMQRCLAPVFDITTESMAMSPVKLEPASPTKLTLVTPLGRATCDAGVANADYC